MCQFFKSTINLDRLVRQLAEAPSLAECKYKLSIVMRFACGFTHYIVFDHPITMRILFLPASGNFIWNTN